MGSQIIYTGLNSLDRKLTALKLLDPTPLLVEWRRLIEEDNRRGILAGTDGWGHPLQLPLSKRKGKYKGATGPPLAPFGEKSRTIANFRTAHGRDGINYFALGAWEDVLMPRPRKIPGAWPSFPSTSAAKAPYRSGISLTSDRGVKPTRRPHCTSGSTPSFARLILRPNDHPMGLLSYPKLDLDPAPETVAFRGRRRPPK